MAIKIAYLLLALAATCSCLNFPTGRFGIRVRVGPGAGYNRKNLPPVGIRRPVIPAPGVPGSIPDVGRHPIDLRPGGYFPGTLPPGGINRPWPVGYVPGHLPPGRYPLNPGWNQGGHDPFRPQGMYHGPFNNGPFYGNPQMLPRPGGNFGPGGPPPRHPIQRRPDFSQINYRSRYNNDNDKVVSKGTVVITVVAVNKTDKESVHANVTITVMPKEGDNKETLKLDTKQHLNTAQSIVDEILNKHKDEEQKSKKTRNNLENVLNKLVLPKI